MSAKVAGVREWFAMCGRPAVVLVPHPVLGQVPACQRCAARAEDSGRGAVLLLAVVVLVVLVVGGVAAGLSTALGDLTSDWQGVEGRP